MIVFLAQVQTLPDAPGYTDVVGLNAIPTLFGNILGVAVALIGLVSFVMLLSGGVRFLTSGGDQKGVEQAKSTLTWAILGLVLAILAFLILKYLGAFLGITDITIFKWPT